jgi:hypothetical protein
MGFVPTSFDLLLLAAAGRESGGGSATWKSAHPLCLTTIWFCTSPSASGSGRSVTRRRADFALTLESPGYAPEMAFHNAPVKAKWSLK